MSPSSDNINNQTVRQNIPSIGSREDCTYSLLHRGWLEEEVGIALHCYKPTAVRFVDESDNCRDMKIFMISGLSIDLVSRGKALSGI